MLKLNNPALMIIFFSIPDKEKNYESYMLYVLCISWTVILSIIVSIGFIAFPHVWHRWLTLLLVAVLIAIINLSLNYLGHTRMARWTFTIMLWLYITIPCYSAGGILATGILTQTSVILTAGFLLGWRGGAGICLLTLGVDFGLAYMQTTGHLPVPTVIHTPLTRWISAIMPFGTILVLQYYATNHLRSGLIALQREILKREEAEKITHKTMYDLKERVKELKTLYTVSSILENEDTPLKNLFNDIAESLPPGWQYPQITAARICFAGNEYTTSNFKPSEYCQQVELKTNSGSILSIEVVYLQPMPISDEGPFLFEERKLMNALAEMIIMNLERRERSNELKDYKHALDLSYMVGISGADRCFTYVNNNFCNATKYSEAELLGKDYSLIMSSFHSAEYFKELNIALQDGKPYRAEFCNKAKDGTLYWVDSTIVPFLDDNGNVYQYLSINHDITERKEADDKIKEREAELTAFFENIEGAASLLDVNKRYLLFNRRFIYDHKLLSNHDPYIGEDVWDFLPDDLRKQRYQMLDNVLQGIKEVIEVDYVRNGKRIYYRSSFNPVITNGKVTGISTYSIDLTKSKEAEEKIKESEQLLKRITSQIPGNTYMFEIEESGKLNILFISRGTDTFNYPDEITKNNVELLMDTIHADDIDKFNDAMKEAYRTESMISFQYRIVVNENIRWRWMQATPDKDQNGKTLWYGSTSDITPLVDYIVSIEQIMFDIGHVIRRPIASMLGLTKLIIEQELKEEELKEMSHNLYAISLEMDSFISELNIAYEQKRQITKHNIDISSLINKRGSLFNR